jgi:phospholipid/cholesterol/gamma-HCH transport system permease protein
VHETEFTLAEGGEQDGVRRLKLAGRLTLQDCRGLWRRLRDLRLRRCTVDFAEVHYLDGGAAALLSELQIEVAAAGGRVDFVGAQGETAKLLQLYACPEPINCAKPPPQRLGILDQIGRVSAGLWLEGRRTLAFVGDFSVGLWKACRRPRSVHWADLGGLIERAGADGLPIALLLNFLVGLVLALQGAIQLRRFGGEPFLANLVGLTIVRELGPLMTAILVAGRSGAAFAAELGTMNVTEEVDALRTLGQDPQRFLVFPRILALLIAVPLLTALADIVGCLGGLFIAVTYLEYSPIAYLHRLQDALKPSDVFSGMLKSVWFAGLIGIVACQRGLSARGGAAAVGASTTSAVVVALFGLIALDTVFAWVFSLLGW